MSNHRPPRPTSDVNSAETIFDVSESAAASNAERVPAAPRGIERHVRLSHLAEMKRTGRPIVMVTAYDAPGAAMADEAGTDVILVGDSVGMVVHGFESTLPVTMDMMVLHGAAAARGSKRSLLVVDLPFMSYQATDAEAVRNAGRLMQEGGAHAVKLETYGEPALDRLRAIASAGIPVMGHVGLVPQSVHALSGYRIQGRAATDADRIRYLAEETAKAGAFAVVLECLEHELAADITRRLPVPTIGIGSGAACDGQVLVLHDLLGLSGDAAPGFAKRYADLHAATVRALRKYGRDVRERLYPVSEVIRAGG